jgi:hypothetical protein
MSYLQALWALALCAVLAAAWLDAAGASALAAARHAAMRAAELAIDRSQDVLVETLAAEAEGGAGVFTAPSPGPAIPVCPGASEGGSPCPLWVSTAVTLAGQTGAGSNGANQTALNVQGQPAVAEQRVGATVSAVVATAAGVPVAQLSRRITIRTLATWPYATLSGSDEPSVEGIAVGDFAGACSGGTCGDDARVHAVLTCSDPAQPQLCAGQGYVPVDAFTSPPWYDANAAPSGWSQ